MKFLKLFYGKIKELFEFLQDFYGRTAYETCVFVPEVAGEDGAGAVKNACDRAHKCGECGGELEAFEAAREELEHELRVGTIRAPELRGAHVHAGLAYAGYFCCIYVQRDYGMT